MSHNAYIRAGAIWTGSATVTTAEMSAFDVAQFKAINGDDGGTWAPASPIIIGGAGLQLNSSLIVTNLCSFNSGVNGFFVPAGGVIQMQGIFGGTGGIDLISGSVVNVNTGSSIKVNTGGILEVFAGGTIELDASVDYAYTAARTIIKKGCRLFGSTDGGAVNTGDTTTPPASSDAWQSTAFGGSVVSRQITASVGNQFQIELPDPIPGSTITSVVIRATGVNVATNPTTWPTYEVRRFDNNGNSVSLSGGGPVPDAHQGSGLAWTGNIMPTTFTPNQNNTSVDPGVYKYVVVCTSPALAGTGSQVCVTEVEAHYSTTTLKR